MTRRTHFASDLLPRVNFFSGATIQKYMEISERPYESGDSGIHTPDVSLYIPSPSSAQISYKEKCVTSQAPGNCMQATSSAICMTTVWRMPLQVNSTNVRGYLDRNHAEYSGLSLERFTIHQGRFGSTEDSSLLEAIVQSAYDDFKSVRIVAEGSESVHSFVGALSEEFLNCPSAVQLRQVTVLSPDECGGNFTCLVETIYPALPRFRHLARTYLGVASSDRSALDASLSAACNAVGQILLTFQPDGYRLPEAPRPETPVGKHVSPLPSTIASPAEFDPESSLLDPVFLQNSRLSPKNKSMLAKFRTLFICGPQRP